MWNTIAPLAKSYEPWGFCKEVSKYTALNTKLLIILSLLQGLLAFYFYFFISFLFTKKPYRLNSPHSRDNANHRNHAHLSFSHPLTLYNRSLSHTHTFFFFFLHTTFNKTRSAQYTPDIRSFFFLSFSTFLFNQSIDIDLYFDMIIYNTFDIEKKG
jgi:hypothetical protein